MRLSPGQRPRRASRCVLVAVVLTALLASLLPGLLALLPASAVVPPPTADTSVINVNVGGDRTGVNGVTPLAGVALGFFEGATERFQCTSLADGDCNVIVPDTGVRGSNRGKQFTIRPLTVPAGWYANLRLRTGNADGTDSQATPYEFTTPRLYGNQVYRSGFEFMTGTGNRTRIASGGTWQQSRNNPVLPSTCGLDVALILDLSGSVAGLLPALKSAAGTFTDALVGTPSRMSLFSFADNSPAATGGNFPSLTSVSTQTQADAFKSRWAPWTAGGGTNWDRGIAQAGSATDTFDVVVMITDGNPSREDDPTQGPGDYTRFKEVEAGIFSANQVKAQGSRMLVAAVGNGVSGDTFLNLAAISGPTPYDPADPNPETADYFRGSYAQAGAALRTVALSNCISSVSVTKLIVPANGTVAEAEPAGAGWEFDAAGGTGVTVTPPSTETTGDGTGTVNFKLSFAGTNSGPVTVAETQQAGYSLVAQGGDNAVCTDRSSTTPTPVVVSNVAGPNGPGFQIPAAASGQVISCVMYNRAPAVAASIQVDKRWVINNVEYDNGEQPDDFQTGLLLSGPDDPDPTDQSWGSPRDGYVTGQAASIDEADVDVPSNLCTVADPVVTNAAGTTLSTSLPYSATLAAGDNVYTITNTVTCDTQLTLVKEVLNGPAAPADWTLAAAGPGGTGFSGQTGTPATTDQAVTPDVPYTLSETGTDPNYEQQDVDADPTTRPWLCVQIDELRGEQPGFVDGLEGVVTVPLGSRVVCTAYNQTATLELQKRVVNRYGGDAESADWTLTATPVNAPSVEAQSVIGSETFEALNVRPGVTYRVTENGPDGYTGTVTCDIVTDNPATDPPPTTDLITVPALETGQCTFTNRDDPAYLTLVKEVDNRGGGTRGEADWTLRANGPRNLSGITGTPEVTRVSVPAGRYRLSESGPTDYAASDWNCQNGTETPVTVERDIDVPDNGDVRCVITNSYVPPPLARLTLVKVVDNTGGGGAGPSDWTLRADGPKDLSGRSGSADVTGVEVPAGRYRLTESGGPSNYDASAWSCQNRTETPVETPTEITLAAGSDVRCILTNFYDPPDPPIPPLSRRCPRRVVPASGPCWRGYCWCSPPA